MSERIIGHNQNEFATMPESRLKIIDARFIPRLGRVNSMLAHSTPGQLDFIAQVLS